MGWKEKGLQLGCLLVLHIDPTFGFISINGLGWRLVKTIRIYLIDTQTSNAYYKELFEPWKMSMCT